MANRKYPWEKWLGDPRTVIKRGVDYNLSQAIMFQVVKNNATLRRKRIRLVDTNDGLIIEVLGRREDAKVSHSNKTPLTT